MSLDPSRPGLPGGARPRIPRRPRPPSVISLTPLVDVLLILVVFFLVTSTYLDLDMIPMVETDAAAPEAGAAQRASAAAPAAGPAALLVRIDAAGRAHLGAERLAADALAAALRARLSARPDARVLILPSPLASTQALVDVLSAGATAEAGAVRVVRVAGPDAPRSAEE